MKKIYLILCVDIVIMVTSCGLADVSNATKVANFEREATSVKYSSEYATTINKLELNEANFGSYRRVVFYNVRIGENVFVCEGYCHVQIDGDGDVDSIDDFPAPLGWYECPLEYGLYFGKTEEDMKPRYKDSKSA